MIDKELELKDINNKLLKITYVLIVLEVFYVIAFFSLTPILGESSSTFTEFGIYIFLLSMFYIPLKISRKFLLELQKKVQMQIKRKSDQENFWKNQKERIFTENDRTFSSYREYEQNNQSQQKSEFYVNKNIKNIIHEKELLILNLEIKELKFYNKSDIKNAYRKVAKENHPDFGKNEQDIKARTERMFAINSAYEVLFKKVK